jgi:rhodanese-related sulfurtransferase
MKTVSAKEVKQLMSREQDVPVINVLPAEQFREQHIPNSVNIPLGSDDFVGAVESIVPSKQAKVVVYCASADCNASPKAASELERAGFEHVHDFEGGVQEWKEAGFDLAGEAVRS